MSEFTKKSYNHRPRDLMNIDLIRRSSVPLMEATEAVHYALEKVANDIRKSKKLAEDKDAA